MTPLHQPSPLDRALRPFADVRPGEGPLAVLAKQAIDSFFFRMGDVVSAAVVFVGTHVGLSAAGFAKLNVLLAAAFLAFAILVGRAYKARTGSSPVALGQREPRQAHA
jgi:hypothetical protein